MQSTIACLSVLVILGFTSGADLSDVLPVNIHTTIPANTTTTATTTPTTTPTTITTTANKTTTATTTIAPNTTTTATTTIAPNTTTDANTTTTATTTITPNTTTTATTTFVPNTTTDANTTTAANATTAPVPITTMKPSGIPKFQVMDGNTTCLLLQSNINIIHLVEKKNVTSIAPANADYTGNCDNETNVLSISWFDQTVNYEIGLTFEKDRSNFELSHVIISINYTKPSEANMTELRTALASSYNCTQGFNVTVDTINLDMKDLRVQAFMDSTDDSPQFGKTGSDCYNAKSKTDAIVPIAVGAALAAMVLIVLVGYCIGRRRQNAGYQSMNA